jgi:hypothetical protein
VESVNLNVTANANFPTLVVRLTMPRTIAAQKAIYEKEKVKVKQSAPLQAWSGPEGSRKLRFPDFITTAQDGGKVVNLTHRPPLPPGNTPGLISVRSYVDPRSIVRPEGLCH